MSLMVQSGGLHIQLIGMSGHPDEEILDETIVIPLARLAPTDAPTLETALEKFMPISVVSRDTTLTRSAFKVRV